MAFDFNGTRRGATPATKKNRKRNVLTVTADDPLAGVEYSGNVETDALREADVLYSELKAARKQQSDRVRAISDSEYWFAVCFRDRASKDAFLRQVNATRLGDKYIDGHALARLLKVDLGE